MPNSAPESGIRLEEVTMNEATQRTGTRQLLIGLDAAEWELVSRWAAAGKLPNFRRLIEQGTRGILSSTAEQLPDTVWASLYTGTNPGKHEKYFYIQYDPRSGGLRHLTDDAIHQTPFWELLSQAGRRVGIVDLPKFPPSRRLNGFQVTNWGAHATRTAPASLPRELLAEVKARFGSHPVGDCDAVMDRPRALQGLRRRALEGIQLRGELNRWLMRERPWDLFFAAFSEPHCIGHHFWHWLDPTHPRYGEPDTHGLADTIEQVYCAIDREIGEMLALVGGDTLCMVFAAHGMGPIYHASWNLAEILDLLGYGRPSARRLANSAAASRTARVNPWRLLKMAIPGPVQYRIKAMLPQPIQEQLLFRWYTGGRRWAGCRAFAIPNNDSVGAIRVNVRGRDRHGLVGPGEEYQRICSEIADALQELTEPASGRPVVRRVTLTHTEFCGPFLDQLPDLTVLWDQSFRWEALHSPRFGTLRLRRQDGRSGSHSEHGFVLAIGPGVEARRELTGGSIYDIAPTVLQIARVPVPAEMDGRALALQRTPVPA
jgi:predicted AlkP superfamily phosphohydrolase/phosphomutase